MLIHCTWTFLGIKFHMCKGHGGGKRQGSECHSAPDGTGPHAPGMHRRVRVDPLGHHHGADGIGGRHLAPHAADTMRFMGVNATEDDMAFFPVEQQEASEAAMQIRIQGMDIGLVEAVSVALDEHCGCAFSACNEGHPLDEYHTLRWMRGEDNRATPLQDLMTAISYLQGVYAAIQGSTIGWVDPQRDNPESTDQLEVEIDGHISEVIVNALRRAMVDRVPTMAADEMVIECNTTGVIDELLAHRVALIPIQIRGGEVPLAQQRTKFAADVSIPESAPHITVVDSSSIVPADEQVHLAFTNETFSVPVAKMAPGQCLRCTVVGRVGYGYEHAKFSPVSASASFKRDDVNVIRFEPIGSLRPSVILLAGLRSVMNDLNRLRVGVALIR